MTVLERRGLLAVVALAVVVRLVLFLVVAPEPSRFHTADTPAYLALARDLETGYADRDSSLFETGLERTPGYPVMMQGILSLAADEEVAVILVQIAASVGLVTLVFLFTLRLAGLACASVAGAILAVDPTTAVYANYLLPGTFFAVAVLAATIIFLSGARRASSPTASTSTASLRRWRSSRCGCWRRCAVWP